MGMTTALVRQQLGMDTGPAATKACSAPGATSGVCGSAGASLLSCVCVRMGTGDAALPVPGRTASVAAEARAPDSSMCVVSTLLLLAEQFRQHARYRDAERVLNTAADALSLLLPQQLRPTGAVNVSDRQRDHILSSCASWDAATAELAAIRVVEAYRCLAHTKAQGASAGLHFCMLAQAEPTFDALMRRFSAPGSPTDKLDASAGRRASHVPARFAQMLLGTLTAQHLTRASLLQQNVSVNHQMTLASSEVWRMSEAWFGARHPYGIPAAIIAGVTAAATNDPATCSAALEKLQLAEEVMERALATNTSLNTLEYSSMILLAVRSEVAAQSEHPLSAEIMALAALAYEYEERGFWRCFRAKFGPGAGAAAVANYSVPVLACEERDAIRANRRAMKSYEDAIALWDLQAHGIKASNKQYAGFLRHYVAAAARQAFSRFITVPQAAAFNMHLVYDELRARLDLVRGASLNSGEASAAATDTVLSPLSGVLNAEYAQIVLAGMLGNAPGSPKPPASAATSKLPHLVPYVTLLQQLGKLEVAARVVLDRLAWAVVSKHNATQWSAGVLRYNSTSRAIDTDAPPAGAGALLRVPSYVAERPMTCSRTLLDDFATTFRHITRALAQMALALLESAGSGPADIMNPGAFFSKPGPDVTQADSTARQQLWRLLAETAAVADKVFEHVQRSYEQLMQQMRNQTGADACGVEYAEQPDLRAAASTLHPRSRERARGLRLAYVAALQRVLAAATGTKLRARAVVVRAARVLPADQQASFLRAAEARSFMTALRLLQQWAAARHAYREHTEPDADAAGVPSPSELASWLLGDASEDASPPSASSTDALRVVHTADVAWNVAHPSAGHLASTDSD